MTREELKQYLPHREPMLLIDEVELNEQHVAHSKYHVRGDEFFLKGHFPYHPVVPGIILCEIMAQSCAILVLKDLINKIPLYSGMDNIRFKSQVFPGDTIEVEAVLVSHRANMYFCDVKAFVNGHLCARGSLSFALIDDTRKKVDDK